MKPALLTLAVLVLILLGALGVAFYRISDLRKDVETLYDAARMSATRECELSHKLSFGEAHMDRIIKCARLISEQRKIPWR